MGRDGYRLQGRHKAPGEVCFLVLTDEGFRFSVPSPKP